MADPAEDQGIVWSDEFLIGIDELDHEHRTLIEDINRLHRELLDDAAMERIEDTLGVIHARIQAHFALEEHVMLSNKYIHYASHKEEHDQLLDEYTERMASFGRDPGPGARDAIEEILRQWIVDHILSSDKRMSLMVKKDQHA